MTKPAFPVPGLQHDEDFNGISIRDYFAARAPITVSDAMLACGVGANSIGMLPRNERAMVMTTLAQMRADYADAMLYERAK